MRNRSAAGNLSLFALLLSGISLISLWLLNHQYSNENALLHWSKILMIWSSDQNVLESFGLSYPHLPLYLLLPFHYLPGLNDWQAPYLLYAAIGSATLVLWFHHLGQRGYHIGIRILLVLVCATHPFFLWSVTSGSEKALSLLLFYLLCFSFVRMTHYGDVRAFVAVGLVMAIYFFADARALLLFVALLPLIAFIAPPRMISTAPGSVYLVLYLPLLISVLAWCYLNWIFYGDPLLFLESPESTFLGAKHHIEQFQWLQSAGGKWLQPLLTALIFILLAYPILIWLARRASHHKMLLRSMLVIFLHPVLAVTIGTHEYFLSHPAEMLFLFGTGVMAIIIMLPRQRKSHQLVLVGLLALGNVGGWLAFSWIPTPEMQRWQQALAGNTVAAPHAADERLGIWLAEHRLPTLIDNRAGYRVIVSRGDAHDLILPFMDSFKLNLMRRAPVATQIAVTAPDSPQAAQDGVGQRYPQLYAQGLPGYRLVYDDDVWRVYRREGNDENVHPG